MPRRLQADHVHVQDAARPDTTVLVGRLSAHLRRKSLTIRSSDCSDTLTLFCRACHGPELVWVTDHLLLSDHRWNSLPADLRLMTTMLALGDS